MHYLAIERVFVYPKTKFPSVTINAIINAPFQFAPNGMFLLNNTFHIAFVFVGRFPGPGY